MKPFQTKRQMIWHFLKGSKAFFAAGMIFAALVALLDMISPKIITFAVDSVIGDAAPALPAFLTPLLNALGGIAGLRERPYLIAAAIAVLALLSAIFRYLFRRMNSAGAETLVKRMRDRLFGHIQYLPFTWFDSNNTGDIIQRCTSDVDTIKRFVSEQMTMLIRMVILIVMALIFMLGISPVMTLIAAVFIPVIIAYSLYFHKHIAGAFAKADTEEGVLSTIAQENLTGVRVVRAFGREAYEREKFESKNYEYTNLWIRLMKLLSFFWSTGDLMTGLQVLAVMVAGVLFCVNGSITAGEYIAFVAYNTMLRWPVRMLGRIIAEMSKAGVSLERVMYIMNSEQEHDAEAAEEMPLHADIRFENVSFAYTTKEKQNGKDGEETVESQVPVFENVSFTVKAGTTVGILGNTGSGKSTLMYLMDRLYELPKENGRITIGGKDIKTLKASSLRTNIGMVLQEPFLFSATLAENISITDEKQDMDMIRYAARIASLDETVSGFSGGYETTVGERGVTLSGGQKQRTAIAQMLLKRPDIMVFDDSLSAVDAETDMKIRNALKENTSDSTVIIIAHRITTLMNADNILVLDKGRVAESGTHEELLKHNGIYRRIFDLQENAAEL